MKREKGEPQPCLVSFGSPTAGGEMGRVKIMIDLPSHRWVEVDMTMEEFALGVFKLQGRPGVLRVWEATP